MTIAFEIDYNINHDIVLFQTKTIASRIALQLLHASPYQAGISVKTCRSEKAAYKNSGPDKYPAIAKPVTINLNY